MTSEINLEKVAGFCRGGRKRKVLKIADFQNFSSFCFRYEWSHLDNGTTIKHREYQTFNPSIEMGRSRLLLLQISMFFRHVGHD